MALTDEQLVLQADILASKTDSNTNPKMAYKTNATLNKGLNPEFFSGNYTKIVNALNQLASNANAVSDAANAVTNKVNSILLDTSAYANQIIWENVQALMDKPTIIEGLQHMLQGNRQEQLLNLKSDDVGKFLSVVTDEDGYLRTKAVEIGEINGGGKIAIEDIEYINDNRPEFSNVKQVIDYLLENEGNFTGGSSAPSKVYWDDILNKPVMPNKIIITDSQLILQSENDEDISTVDLVTNEEIDFIISQLA